MPRPGSVARRPMGAGLTTSIPPWLPLLVLTAGAFVGVRALMRHAAQSGVGVVDTRRFKLHERGAYSCSAWRDRVARVLVGTAGTLVADDRQAVGAFCYELAGLSFIAEVGSPEVVWPDGLTVPLRYREPVACVRTGDFFLAVDDGGQVLLGKSVLPHDAYGASLPVVGRPDYALEFVRPGDLLTEQQYRDGFAVASSMWDYLAPEDIACLGRMVIDASRQSAPDGLPGGVVIDLEDRRRILFGRPPIGSVSPDEARTGTAGELPLLQKWKNVAAAARALRDGKDWVLFDARWDVPEVILRGSEFDLTLASYATGG
ncbi:MAG: hypothetical protein ACI8QZ_001760 [Chlamydiales bacterium]|jgi:hypothetical protein